MPNWICATCCVEYKESVTPPSHCPICEDERQYVGANGQQWTVMDEIGKDHANDWREAVPNMHGIGVTPAIGIGQRALLIETPNGNVLSYQNRSGDSGTLDVDNTSGGAGSVENVFFTAPPTGTYEYWVQLYSGDGGSFSLSVSKNGTAAGSQSGSVSTGSTSSTHYTVGYP